MAITKSLKSGSTGYGFVFKKFLSRNKFEEWETVRDDQKDTPEETHYFMWGHYDALKVSRITSKFEDFKSLFFPHKGVPLVAFALSGITDDNLFTPTFMETVSEWPLFVVCQAKIDSRFYGTTCDVTPSGIAKQVKNKLDEPKEFHVEVLGALNETDLVILFFCESYVDVEKYIDSMRQLSCKDGTPYFSYTYSSLGYPANGIIANKSFEGDKLNDDGSYPFMRIGVAPGAEHEIIRDLKEKTDSDDCKIEMTFGKYCFVTHGEYWTYKNLVEFLFKDENSPIHISRSDILAVNTHWILPEQLSADENPEQNTDESIQCTSRHMTNSPSIGEGAEALQDIQSYSVFYKMLSNDITARTVCDLWPFVKAIEQRMASDENLTSASISRLGEILLRAIGNRTQGSFNCFENEITSYQQSVGVKMVHMYSSVIMRTMKKLTERGIGLINDKTCFITTVGTHPTMRARDVLFHCEEEGEADQFIEIRLAHSNLFDCRDAIQCSHEVLHFVRNDSALFSNEINEYFYAHVYEQVILIVERNWRTSAYRNYFKELDRMMRNNLPFTSTFLEFANALRSLLSVSSSEVVWKRTDLEHKTISEYATLTGRILCPHLHEIEHLLDYAERLLWEVLNDSLILSMYAISSVEYARYLSSFLDEVSERKRPCNALRCALLAPEQDNETVKDIVAFYSLDLVDIDEDIIKYDWIRTVSNLIQKKYRPLLRDAELASLFEDSGADFASMISNIIGGWNFVQQSYGKEDL